MFKRVDPKDLKDGQWYWLLIDGWWFAYKYDADMCDEWVDNPDVEMVYGPIPTPDEVL